MSCKSVSHQPRVFAALRMETISASRGPARREENQRVAGGMRGTQRQMGNIKRTGKLAGKQESLMLEM